MCRESFQDFLPVLSTFYIKNFFYCPHHLFLEIGNKAQTKEAKNLNNFLPSLAKVTPERTILSSVRTCRQKKLEQGELLDPPEDDPKDKNRLASHVAMTVFFPFPRKIVFRRKVGI